MAGSVVRPERFDVRGAIETIDRARSYREPLRRRTEGVAWMVWSLVGALTFAVLLPSDAGYVVWYAGLCGFWPVVGLLSTSAVWHVAALSRPSLAMSAKRIALAVVGGAAAIFALGSVGYLVYASFGTWIVTAAVVAATPWGFVNAVQWSRMSHSGRRLATVAGATIALAASGFVLTDPVLSDGVLHAGFVAIVCGIPFGFGAWHVFRG